MTAKEWLEAYKFGGPWNVLEPQAANIILSQMRMIESLGSRIDVMREILGARAEGVSLVDFAENQTLLVKQLAKERDILDRELYWLKQSIGLHDWKTEEPCGVCGPDCREAAYVTVGY